MAISAARLAERYAESQQRMSAPDEHALVSS